MTVTRLGRYARPVLPALVALVWLVAAVPALAHAELEETSPADRATVPAPGEVSATFSEALVGASRLDLLDPTGATVATGGIDPLDDTRLVLDVPVGAAPGEYEVRWQAFSRDGHLERGTFAFTIAAPTPPPPTPPPSAAPTTTAAPSPTASPTAVPLPSPSASPAPMPTSGPEVLIPIVGALLVLGVLGAALLRRRGGRGA